MRPWIRNGSLLLLGWRLPPWPPTAWSNHCNHEAKTNGLSPQSTVYGWQSLAFGFWLWLQSQANI